MHSYFDFCVGASSLSVGLYLVDRFRRQIPPQVNQPNPSGILSRFKLSVVYYCRILVLTIKQPWRETR